jgi:hypothetical protein
MEMSSHLLSVSAVYVLGFVGLFAVAVLPLRVFITLRRRAYLWGSSSEARVALLVVGASGLLAVSLGVQQVAGVFRCLTEMYCGANKASGWFFLVALGILYLAFELIAKVVFSVARKFFGVAT